MTIESAFTLGSQTAHWWKIARPVSAWLLGTGTADWAWPWASTNSTAVESVETRRSHPGAPGRASGNGAPLFTWLERPETMIANVLGSASLSVGV